MLLELRIKDYVIIEDSTIHFCDGLNIITGETGSGKSLLFDCIGIILGGKFSKDTIRSNASKSLIQAMFSIEDQEILLKLENYGIIIDEDNNLVITREVQNTGKSSIRINGNLSTLSMLKDITSSFSEIIGQSEHQKLLQVSNHIQYLDVFCKDAVESIKSSVKLNASNVIELSNTLESLQKSSIENTRNLELLKYQSDEIEGFHLVDGEEEDLKSKRIRLLNMEKIKNNIHSIYTLLYKKSGSGNTIEGDLTTCMLCAEELLKYDDQTKNLHETIANFVYQLGDLKYFIKDYSNNLDDHQEEMNTIEERLDSIYKLKRKYGSTIRDILDYLEKIKIDISNLDNFDKNYEELTAQLETAQIAYNKAAEKLSQLRKKYGVLFENKIMDELKELNMNHSVFKIKISEDPSMISANGINRVEYYIATNTGMEMKQLIKIASGGELSRIILAIKNSILTKDRSKLLIFDEVDAGIGGVTASIVGLKLKELSNGNQLILISHLPQIVSYAENHILVEKHIMNGLTYSKATVLDKKESIQEIGKMMSGQEINETDFTYIEKIMNNKNL